MLLKLHAEEEYKSLMKIAGYQFPVAVGCLLIWQRDSGLQSCRHMSHVKKKKKKTSCYKHFNENYYPVWNQLRAGVEDKINRQHMKG